MDYLYFCKTICMRRPSEPKSFLYRVQLFGIYCIINLNSNFNHFIGMRVFFSFDYKGGYAYLGMKDQPSMMDVQVTDIGKLFDFLELRLGLRTIIKSDTERLVGYYKSVREYMEAHKDDEDNQLYKSYMVSPLATSREMLKWRDALAACGWDKNTPAPSRRLKVLQGVEQIFSNKGVADVSTRQKAIIERLKQKKGLMKGVTFVMPFSLDLLHPTLKEIFTLAIEDGAQIEQLPIPKIEGDNNLAKLKRLLTADAKENLALEKEDDSVRIWKFKDDMEAEEYLAMLEDNTFDVIVQPNTKLTDNYLHMMGRPVAGSSVTNSAPQIIQLFFTGVAMMAKPLNIAALLQWLYAPIHPLPGSLRYRLAERLARIGGWLRYETTAEDDCYQLVQEWIEGKMDTDNGQAIEKKEKEIREYKASVFLPDFDGGDKNTITVQKLHTFLTELGSWSIERSAMIAQKNDDDQRISQLHRLSDLCKTLKSLTDDLQPTDLLPFSEIEKHLSCLYEPSEFMQYRAQAKSRFTVSSPGQVAAKANKVLWEGLHDFEPMLPATDFLTPTEQDILKKHIQLWDMDDVRKIQQQTMLLPLLFCQNQLTLVTIETVNGESVNKHPLIVRLEQQVKNYRELAIAPQIEESCYAPVPALTNNAISGGNGLYTTIKRTDLLKWREHESPTSLDELIQNPLDYTLEHFAYISDNGQSELSDLSRTKGNVAHAVIQHLFYVSGDELSGYADAIKERVQANYKTVFDKVIETKGAILLLQENAIERKQLFEQLKECIDHLIDIIEQNRLHVVACEKSLNGNALGTPDDCTPEIHGFADMILARENGHHVIFDFKWTASKDRYQKILRKNQSLQLAIYAELLKEQAKGTTLSTAYFLMPRGRLYSTDVFKSLWSEPISIDDGCEGDIIREIVASYRYRREEIMSGKIEMGEGLPLTDLEYFNDTDLKNLFPLKHGYYDDSVKEVNGYSSYGNLKN